MALLRIASAIACAGVCAASSARADTPWEADVTETNRHRANEIFAEANDLFGNDALQAALDKYQQAIALWDHPLIRFNMAVTMIRLDRLLEAADSLDAALRYGAAPYDKTSYQHALDYQKLVTSSVGQVEVTCSQPGLQVLLDAKAWLRCPGTARVRVLAGEHVIVGEKPQYATSSRRIVVTGGATATMQLELRSLDSIVRVVYPTPRWIPWTITGAGLGVALGGLGFWISGRHDMDRFDAQFAMQCRAGCGADYGGNASLRDQHDGAVLKGRIAGVMLAGGGAIAIAGAVWVIVNRPRRVMPTVELAPSPGGTTASVRWRF